jgi:hypothetical protein
MGQFEPSRHSFPADICGIMRSLEGEIAKGGSMTNGKTAREIADIVERFLGDTSLYPQEWNDFVECSQPDPKLDWYRKRCYVLDPLVNSPEPQDLDAIAELKSMVAELRHLENPN